VKGLIAFAVQADEIWASAGHLLARRGRLEIGQKLDGTFAFAMAAPSDSSPARMNRRLRGVTRHPQGLFRNGSSAFKGSARSFLVISEKA